MSETPQEKLERWCKVNTLGITAPIREAIRAVLGQLHDFERERDEARADWVALVDDNTATEAKLAEAQEGQHAVCSRALADAEADADRLLAHALLAAGPWDTWRNAEREVERLRALVACLGPIAPGRRHGTERKPPWQRGGEVSETRRRLKGYAERLQNGEMLDEPGLGADLDDACSEIERLTVLVSAGPWDAWRNAEAEVERLRGMIEQADIEGWTVKGLKGAIAALRGGGRSERRAEGDRGADHAAERARLGYELSTYAAAIRWDGSKNTQEWMDGLRERIEAVQSLASAALRGVGY